MTAIPAHESRALRSLEKAALELKKTGLESPVALINDVDIFYYVFAFRQP
jgi:hypothetical protein